mgnify:CR=1 FL=1
MTVTRKILVPAALIVAITSVVLIAVAVVNALTTAERDEQARLDLLRQAFLDQLKAQETLALALATQAANNPEIQAAFAARDRERLLALTSPTYQALDAQFDIPQYHFHTPPAISFLRLHQPDRYGDDLSNHRATVVYANAERRPVSGLEVGRGGLGVRGVVPVVYQGRHIGTLEFGLNVDQSFIEALKAQLGVDWQILLKRSVIQLAGEGTVGADKGSSPDLLVHASTLETPFFADAAAYAQAVSDQPVRSHLRANEREYAVLSIPLRDFAGRVIGVVDVIYDRTADVAAEASTLALAVGSILVPLALSLIALILTVTRALRPVRVLTEAGAAVAAGDLSRTIAVRSRDEFGAMAQSFNQMTAQLRSFVGSLEQRVAERTRDTEVSAELGRAITSIRNLDALLPHAVDLIKERTGYYHVQIFLLDEDRRYAVLRASTGEVGRRLLEQGHRLAVGSDSVIGRVTARGEPTIALDTEAAAVIHRPNPLLPDTRSEIALPLRIENRVIGALDVQSLEPNAFDDDDVRVLQLLADQVAVAIDNARLLRESEARLQQIEQLNRQLVSQAYDEALRLRRAAAIGFNTTGDNIYEDSQWSPLLTRAMSEHTAVVERADGARYLALPLLLRGVVVGAVEFEVSEEAWAEDTVAIASALVARLADSLETTRLFEQAQRLASRERQVNEVTARLQAQVELDAMVTVAAEEIRRALRARRTAVRVDVE